MNAILGFAEILSNKIDDKTLHNYVSAISSSGSALLGIINDILDLSKIEAGKTQLNYQAVNLNNLLKEVEQIFAHKTKEKNIDFVVDITPDLPEALIIDDLRLKQILINLVGNAVKFTDKGFVHLSVDSTLCDNKGQFSCLTFTVKDSGIGIPKDQISKIFEAFEQQKNQNANKFGGTGLGLTITNRLIKMMGGNINVSSEPGKGSTFEVQFEHIENSDVKIEDSAKVQKDTEQLKFAPTTILVVDDIATNRKLVKSFLEDYSITVESAIDGEQGIKRAEELNPALILMDIKMPVMDGFEATSNLKSNAELKHIPIVAFTASALKDEIEKIHKSDFNGILQKPFSKVDLIETLQQHLIHDKIIQTEDNKAIEPEEDLIPSKLKENILDLLETLENVVQPKWEEIRTTFVLGNIKDFAEEMIKLGEDYDATDLVEWGKNMYEQSCSFDMEQLPGTMNQFDGLVKKYKNIQGQ
jgi:two-component system sensor histidine kinase EvgS